MELVQTGSIDPDPAEPEKMETNHEDYAKKKELEVPEKHLRVPVTYKKLYVAAPEGVRDIRPGLIPEVPPQAEVGELN